MNDTATAADNSASPRTLPTLAKAMWPFRRRVALTLLLLLVSKLAFVAVPWALKQIIDLFSNPETLAILPVFALLTYALLRFLGGVFGELRDLVFARVTQQTVSDLTLRAFDHLHLLGSRFHVGRQTGGIVRDVERGTTAAGYLLTTSVMTLVPTVVEISAIVIIMALAYAPAFTGIILATFVAYSAVTATLTQRRVKLQRERNELDNTANNRLVDSLLNYETVKAHANESFESRQLGSVLEKRRDVSLRTQRALSRLHLSQSAVIAIGVAAVMLLAGQRVVAGGLTVGDLVLINAYVIQICLPLNTLGFVFREARDALVNAERMFKLLDQPPEIVEPKNIPSLVVERGEVRYETVQFGYDPARQVLWDVSFSIPPGGTVAVVGGSGSGKSTIARLLLRYYDPVGGRVLIDGQDLRSVSQNSLRNRIGIVPQDTVLFNDTIAYNIGYSRPGSTTAEIIAAAQAAYVHEFIMGLPEQYETRVGERGLKLSGGEKQRIAIARAILKDPPILILDEATSALDTRSERAIQTELDRISRNRTTLIIAHRLSTVVNADEILVLEHGRVVERGRHDELVGQRGVYAQMWALQQKQSELERTEQRLAIHPVNLAAVLAGVIDALRGDLDARHITLYSATDPQSARVTGDPTALQQALWELVTHTADASGIGGRSESAWQTQPSWDEDRYGYPEATSYRREMSRGSRNYEPESRFASDERERGRPDTYRRGEGWNTTGTAQYGSGGVIDENDYRRYGGDGGRSSGGGYGMAGGYGAMGDYGAEGLWRGDASQGGRGGSTGNPWGTRRGRYARQGPKGYSRADERIKEDVCERLYHADDVDVSDVSVDVSSGTVKLEGTVPERWMKYRIEDICDRSLGVTDIENHVRIARSETRPQEPTQRFEEQAGPRH